MENTEQQGTLMGLKMRQNGHSERSISIGAVQPGKVVYLIYLIYVYSTLIIQILT